MLTDSFVLIVETKLLRIMKEENIYKIRALSFCILNFFKIFFLYQNFENVVFNSIFLNSNNIGIKKKLHARL